MLGRCAVHRCVVLALALSVVACGSLAPTAGGQGSAADGGGGAEGAAAPSFGACPAPSQASASSSLSSGPVCGGSACGNDHRDTCTRSGPSPTAPTSTETEECDGLDLGSETCATQGFASGALACATTCNFDYGACGACVARAEVVGCTSTTAITDTSSPGGFLLTAAGDGARGAAAWIDQGAVHVALVADGPSIHPVSGCFDAGDAQDVAIAPTADGGWILAVDVTGGVDLFVLDGAGALRGDGRRLDGAHYPYLAARQTRGAAPGAVVGGPLLLVTRADPNGEPGAEIVREATVLANDATAERPAAPVPVHPVDDHMLYKPDALFTGDAFLVAERDEGDRRSAIAVTRIGLDGAVGATTYPVESDTEFPRLGVGADGDVRLAYSTFGGGDAPDMEWIAMDANGAAKGPPRALPPLDEPLPPNAATPGFPARVEGDAVLVETGYGLDLAYVSGARAGQRVGVVRQPNGWGPASVLRFGSRLVAVWESVTGPGVTMATIAP